MVSAIMVSGIMGDDRHFVSVRNADRPMMPQTTPGYNLLLPGCFLYQMRLRGYPMALRVTLQGIPHPARLS